MNSSEIELPYPKSSHVTNHWKLLYAFKKLKATIINQPQLETSQEKEKHWQCYVTLAFRRYIIFVSGLKYLFNIVEVGDNVSEETAVEGKDKESDTHDKQEEFGELMDKLLPPLDVIMIWHSFMLNPKSYLGNMTCNQMDYLLNYSFPLDKIAASISESSFLFSPDQEQKGNFMIVVDEAMDTLGLDENFGYDSYEIKPLQDLTLPIYCPCGELLVRAPLTKQGTGFADKSFRMENVDQCQCAMGPVLTMDILRKRKFLYDRDLFDVLPTCYKYYGPKDLGFKTSTDTLFRDSNNSTRCILRHPMEDKELKFFIRDLFIKKALAKEDLLVLRDYVELNPVSLTVPQTPSTFQVHEDLVVAVLRNDRFVDQITMDDLLENPYDTSIIPRAIIRYDNFFRLMRDWPGMVIPTLDIDLVWHTHLLNFPSYSEYSKVVAGQIIGHHDKIDEEKLDKLWDKSCELYKTKYGEQLSLCSCPYCSIDRSPKGMFSFSRILFSKPPPPKDPFIDDHFYHISYHNVTESPPQDPHDIMKKQSQTIEFPWRTLKQPTDYVNDPFVNFEAEDVALGDFYKSSSLYDLASVVYSNSFLSYAYKNVEYSEPRNLGVFYAPYGFGGNGLGTWNEEF